MSSVQEQTRLKDDMSERGQQIAFDELPITPYNNTSGHSGSDTSRERAERDDKDGTTSNRQRNTLNELRYCNYRGITWRELAERYNMHHGQASGVLSVLHKANLIVRLKEKRDKCAVYVLAEYVCGREVSERTVKSCPNCGWHE